MDPTPSKPGRPRRLTDVAPPTRPAEPFYAELDRPREHGRGSCCTLWSFWLLFVTLMVLGCIAILWLRRG